MTVEKLGSSGNARTLLRPRSAVDEAMRDVTIRTYPGLFASVKYIELAKASPNSPAPTFVAIE
jgi:hypothetical protein